MLFRSLMESADESLRNEVVDAFLPSHFRYEDDLGVALPHVLEGLQVSNLHGSLGVEFVGRQPHQFG
mgnify:CR=1 FL=1